MKYVISVTPDLALESGYTYAGGLGVLEGDKFYGAGDLGINYLVFTLLYRNGYVRYRLGEGGNLIPEPQPQEESFLKSLEPIGELRIKLRGEEVSVEALGHRYKSATAIFLNPKRPSWAVKLVDRLYIESSDEERFYKYLLLAKATAAFIKARLKPGDVAYVDLQESYTALLPLVLGRGFKYRLVIHTPGPWGHPTFPREFLEREFGFRLLTSNVVLTELGLALVDEAIAVSLKHEDVMRLIIPHHAHKLRHITNGIYLPRWMDERLRSLYESGKLDLGKLVEVKEDLKKELEGYLRARVGTDVALRGKFVVLWARRITHYKRPYFVSRFIEENRDLDVVFVLAGKAHPHDTAGLGYMREFHELSRRYKNVVYLPEYTVNDAKVMLRGSDLLLFTPFPAWEACGTSYMKAGVNGTPTLSSRDGGALELIIDGLNGWLYGTDLREPLDMGSEYAKKLEERDYLDFARKLREVYDKYVNNAEEFRRVSLNAIYTFLPKVDIARVLHQYYPDLLNS